MILGIGCDIVHIPRIRALLHRSRDASAGPSRVFCDKRAINFARRIFGTDELDAFRKRFILADGKVDERAVTLFLAGRFAVKESSYKALQPHYALDWSDVNIVSENGT
ncbi:hypothetical protein HDU79_008073 [Rhizoclosmatium sp. JEL0117]|nr:hypothetical protein HDU79_008073 [Rhizoclosmatium sp. JEL0117]